jgi:hypothetical protein
MLPGRWSDQKNKYSYIQLKIGTAPACQGINKIWSWKS